MLKSSRGMIAVIVLLGAVVLLAGCQSTPPATTRPSQPTVAAPAAPTTAPAKPTSLPAATAAAPAAPASAPTVAPPSETLKVGILTALTGPVQGVGTNTDRFARMAIDDINAKGGVKVGGKAYKMEGITVDSKMDAETGRQGANRLVLAEKVRFILGSFNVDTNAAQTVTEPNKVIVMPLTCTPVALSPKTPFTFAAGIPFPNMRVPALYQNLVKEHPNVKRVVQVQTDDASGRDYVAMSEGAAKANGLTMASTELFPVDTKDFAPLVTRILRNKPDAIDGGASTSYASFLNNISSTLFEQGFKGPVFGTATHDDMLSRPFFEGYFGAGLQDWRAPIVSQTEKSLIERYLKAYGEKGLNLMMMPGYNLPLILAQAMEKAGTVDDTEKIAATMRQGEWNSMYEVKVRFVGEKTFGIKSVLEQPIYLTKIQGSKYATFTKLTGTLP